MDIVFLPLSRSSALHFVLSSTIYGTWPRRRSACSAIRGSAIRRANLATGLCSAMCVRLFTHLSPPSPPTTHTTSKNINTSFATLTVSNTKRPGHQSTTQRTEKIIATSEWCDHEAIRTLTPRTRSSPRSCLAVPSSWRRPRGAIASLARLVPPRPQPTRMPTQSPRKASEQREVAARVSRESRMAGAAGVAGVAGAGASASASRGGGENGGIGGENRGGMGSERSKSSLCDCYAPLGCT